jgi:hypothetical protein
MVQVVTLQRYLVGIAIRSLYFVDVEARREKQHGLAVGRDQCLINIGCHPAGTGQDAEGGRFQHCKVAVAAANADDGIDVQRISIRIDHFAILHCPHLKIVRGIDKRISFIISRAMAQHGQRFIYSHDQGFPRPAGKPLHFTFKVARGDLRRSDSAWQPMSSPMIPVTIMSQHFQHVRNIGEVFVGIPALPHALDIQLEGWGGQAFLVEDAHRPPIIDVFLDFCRAAGWKKIEFFENSTHALKIV